MANNPPSKGECIAAIQADSLSAYVANLDYEQLGQVAVILVELHNDKLLNLISFFERLDWIGMSSSVQWKWCEILGESLGGIQNDPVHVIEFIYMLLDQVPKGSHHYILDGYGQWVNTNVIDLPEIASFLQVDQRESELLIYTLSAWKNVDATRALQSTLDFSYDGRPKIRIHAISMLGKFSYEELLQSSGAEARLMELVNSNDIDDKISAINSIIKILEQLDSKPESLLSTLDSVATKPSVEVLQQLIFGLAFHPDAFSTEIRCKIFLLMRTVSIEHGRTLGFIDHVFRNTSLDQESQLIFDTLTALMLQEYKAPSLKSFDMTTHKILSASHSKLGWFIIMWLLDGKYLICRQLDTFFPPLDSNCYAFSLDFIDLSEAEIFYLARKVFVYLMLSHGPAVAILSICLMKLKVKTRKNLEKEIAGFWLRNYPEDIKLFNELCQNYPQKGLRASIDRMRKMVVDYERPLRNLPNNAALKPSTIERRVHQEIAHQRQKKISKQTEKSSIFASIFNKSTLLHGRSSVTYIYRDKSQEPIRQEMKLQSHEASFALPRMNILCPAHLHYLLYQFRRESRPE